MDGSPPRDPSVLENESVGGVVSSPSHQTEFPAPTPSSTSSPAAPSVPTHLPKTHPLLSRSIASSKATPSKPASAVQTPVIDLFADDPSPTPAPIATAPAPPQPASSSVSNIFDLDFRTPSVLPPSDSPPDRKSVV